MVINQPTLFWASSQAIQGSRLVRLRNRARIGITPIKEQAAAVIRVVDATEALQIGIRRATVVTAIVEKTEAGVEVDQEIDQLEIKVQTNLTKQIVVNRSVTSRTKSLLVVLTTSLRTKISNVTSKNLVRLERLKLFVIL